MSVTASKKIIYNDPAVPEYVYMQEDFLFGFRSMFMEEMSNDSPGEKDIRSIFQVYNDASLKERDLINRAFVWATGWTLPTLAAKASIYEGSTNQQDAESVESTLEDWKKQDKTSE